MNAVSNSETNLTADNVGGSDSDTNPDELPEYYQPISTGANEDEELSDQNSDSDYEPNFYHLANGTAPCVENGISSIDLSDDEDEEEEEERMREAMQRAFREDESRRSAPLPPENAARVMEAMRGISFGGLAPEWAGRVPEDRWINELRSIRQSPSSST